MVTTPGRATSPIEAFWTLHPRTLALPSISCTAQLAGLVPREYLETWRALRLDVQPPSPRGDLAPVLPVRSRDDGPDVVHPEAAAAVEQMLDARVDLPTVFDEPQASVHALARWSGGHIRHVLVIARKAVEQAEPRRATVADIEQAGRQLGVQLCSLLRPEDLPRVVEIHRTHRVLPTEQDLRLIEHACVLPLHGEPVGWDVHPALWAVELFQQAQRALEWETVRR